MNNNKGNNQQLTRGEFREFADFVVRHVTTKEDLQQYTTKQDLEPFAIKRDLERFATKKDLEQFATKVDLQQYTTKQDLKAFGDRALKIFATKEDLKQFTTKDEMKESFDKVLTATDKMSKKLDTFLTEKTVLGGQVQDHESRIGKLEAKAGV